MKGFASGSASLIASCLWLSIASAAQSPGSMAAPAVPAPVLVTMGAALKQALTHPHLRPDLRFTEALQIVETFPGAPPGAAPTTEFAQSDWSVSYDGRLIGTLPEYPDFTDAMSMLRQAAKGHVAGLHVPSGDTPPADVTSEAALLDEHSLIQALEALNGRYGQKGLAAADLTLAAEAVSRLSALEDDRMGTADALYAKAMALVALAETVTGKSMPKEESMLAYSMGYGRTAWDLLKQLPGDDDWRLYIERDDDTLERTARLHPDDPNSNYLWLRRLADLSRANDWASLMKVRYRASSPPPAVFDTELRMSDIRAWGQGGDVVPLLVLTALPGTEHLGMEQVDTAKAPAKVLAYFDQGVPYVGGVVKGPYLSGDEAVAYYRGFMDTGVAMLGRYFLDAMKDQAATRSYHDLLGAASGDNGRELYAWYDAKWHADQPGLYVTEVMSLMGSARVLSPQAYDPIWRVMSVHGGFDGAQMHDAAWWLTSHYDTRTDARLDFAETLHSINDTPDFEEVLKSLADQESDRSPSVKLKLAGYENDLKPLFQAALDKSLDKHARVDALLAIRDERESPDQVRSAYRTILADYPDYSFAYISYVRFLDSIKDYAEIEHIAPAWLTADTSAGNGFDYMDACVAAADAELKLGHVDAAWATISRVLFRQSTDPKAKPEIATYYGKVLAEGVFVALAKGDLAEAEMLAQFEADRFPERFDRQIPLLGVYWAEKRYADAANYVAAWRYQMPSWDWGHGLAYEFDQVFDSDPQAGAKAYKALSDAKSPLGPLPLYSLATAIESTDPNLEFAMRQALIRPELEGQENLFQLLHDYEDLKASKGIEAARAWALPKMAALERGNADTAVRTAAAKTTYQTGLYELLWVAVPNPDAASDPAKVWLLFAAAHLQQPTESPQQLAALKQHFANAGDGWYDLLGKYLMGDVKADQILGRPLDRRALSEASYYFALRALAEQRYTDAEGWLDVDDGTQLADSDEYQWGLQLRSHWNQAYESLAVLDRQGRLYQNRH